MEGIIEAINRLIEAVNQNSIPFWVTCVGIFVPIIISVSVAISSCVQNKKNNKLQKEIEESSEKFQSAINMREEYIQMRDNFLKIYDDFCLAQSILVRMHRSVHVIFSNYLAVNGYTVPYQLVNDVNNVENTICQALNRAKLLLPCEDENLRNTLEVIHSKFMGLCGKINSYYYEGYSTSTSENAWNVISSNGIVRYDYYTLMRNTLLYDSYLKLCDTDGTKEIERLIEELLPLFDYDKFDKFFEPYLQMSSVERNLDNVNNQ